MKYVLASKSPRRKELLELLDIDFDIVSADIDETVNPSLPIVDEISRLSYEKAFAVSDMLSSDTVIISADTVVELDGKILGKPDDKNDALKMLKALSDNTHNVITCVTVMCGDKHLTEAVTTKVTFRKISNTEITDYIKTEESMDKAGAYGIQGRASKFVSHIDGDYFNVVGLPVCTLSLMLKQFDTTTEE
ncbi:MAG: Maf family protein [Clostridia bacterium]|nr:Maf family protein [Clostridia bacterium]